MKTNEEIISEIKEEAEKVTKRPINSNVTMDTNFRNELGFDSIELLYLIMALETRFGISFEQSNIEELDTVGAVVQFVAAQLK